MDLGTSHRGSQSHHNPPARRCTQPWPYRCRIGAILAQTPPHGAASILAAPLLPATHVVTQPHGQEVNPCRDGQEIVQQVAHTLARQVPDPGVTPPTGTAGGHCSGCGEEHRAEMLLPKGGASTSVRSPPAVGPTWCPVGNGLSGSHQQHCSASVIPRTLSCIFPLPDRGLGAQHLGTGGEKKHQVTACAGTLPSWGPCCSWGISLAPGSDAPSVEEPGPARQAARGQGVRAGSAPVQHLLHHCGWGNVSKLNLWHWC